MSGEISFPITDDEIVKAERSRVAGSFQQDPNYHKLESLVRNFLPTGIEFLSPEDQRRYLMSTRIKVVTNIGQANGSWRGESVVQHLREARLDIVRIYDNPKVRAIAQDLGSDSMGVPYGFLAEMRRDRSSYSLILAMLTGVPRFLLSASSQLVQEREETEKSAKATAAFERDSIFCILSSNSGACYESLKDSYREAIGASLEGNRWERIATIGIRFAFISFRYKDLSGMRRGMLDSLDATRHDPSLNRLVLREIGKGVIGGLRYKIWRRTLPQDWDYATLALPN